ncbi:MAG: sigma-70 family RNA polymerase sigma factor [Saprospiraceae bacterium]|nr:sigma-70 family RNA polymerase sigma factor [Saprospiraceae bacterium]MCB0626301.1 sigma-70 family RNA polymerase sigma factor [Saprospiraceae bacterium]MCB0677795.1 sigma-70 family RNA polymerase sigma factor [Saprospiraceae bacterium]
MADPPRPYITSVVQQYSNRLFGFIRSRVPSTADAEDILQEVWYQFSRVVDTEPIEQVSAWLFRVARNRITDRYRKRREDRLDDLTGEGEELFSDILLAEADSPEMDMLREAFWEALFEALEELPENQREVFVWNELEDQTFQEISDRTGVNIKTLISRKRYAVQYLRKRLQSLYEELITD